MIHNKFLSDAVHMDEISAGAINMITAPVGSGKTHWALNVLPKTVSKPYKMVYLIDTTNAREQLAHNLYVLFLRGV